MSVRFAAVRRYSRRHHDPPMPVISSKPDPRPTQCERPGCDSIVDLYDNGYIVECEIHRAERIANTTPGMHPFGPSLAEEIRR